MRRYCYQLIGLLSLGVTLSACGGGGGSGGSSGGQSPPPPPTPSTDVAITDANAFEAIQVGAALLEAPVQVALAAVNPFIDLLNAGVMQQTVACGSGGTIDLAATDVDSSGTINVGDTVTVAYNNSCFSADLNDRVTGTFELRIDNLIFGNDQLVINAGLSTPGGLSVAGQATLEIDATFSVGAVVRNVVTEVLTLDMASNERLTISGITGDPAASEDMTQLTLKRFVNGTTSLSGGYSISASFAVRSDILGGNMRCRTEPDLVADELADLPQAGTLQCDGRGNSAVRVRSDGSSGSAAPVTFLVDPEGDGSFVTASNPSGNASVWENLIEGGLVDRRITRANSFPITPDELTVDSVALSLNDLVYAPGRNRLIGLTETALVEIDPTTLMVTRSVDMPSAPATLGVSDDESVAWVALNESNELQRVSLDTMLLGAAYPLGFVPPNNINPRAVGRVRVAPGTQDLVVVATSNGIELLAYNNGGLLPGRLDANTSPNFARTYSFVFRTATDIVAADTETTGHAVVTATLDPVSGVSLGQVYSGLAGRGRDRMQIGADNVYLSSGRIFNDATVSVEGDLRPSICCLDNLVLDSDSGNIYAIETVVNPDTLHLYVENGLFRVGSYALPGSGPVRGYDHLTVTPNFLFMVGDGELHRLNRAEILPNLDESECSRQDLSGVITDGTFISINCAMTDAVYDVERNLIYAGLDENGSNGNSIAVIDPNQFEIVNYIPLGARAGMLKLSADNAKLYATLESTSKIVEISLDAQVIDRVILLGFEGTVFGPYFSGAIAASRGPDGDIVVAENRDVALFSDGARLGSTGFNNRAYSDVFASADGALAYAQYNGSLETFSISSSGVSFLQSLDNMVNRRASFRGNFIYSDDGRRVDMASGTSAQACETMIETPFTTRIAAPDFATDLVYFGAVSDNASVPGLHFRMVACNPETMDLGTPTETPVFVLTPGQAKALLPLPGNRIALLSDAHLVLLDKPAL